jgi:hypothetical protein
MIIRITSAQRETDKMLFIDVNGSDNTIATDQKDSGQHFLDITVGSNQTVNSITTRHRRPRCY